MNELQFPVLYIDDTANPHVGILLSDINGFSC